MASPLKPPRKGEWLSKVELSEALNVSVSYFDRAIRPHAAPADVRRDGRRLIFRARPIIERWMASRVSPEAVPLCFPTLPAWGLDA